MLCHGKVPNVCFQSAVMSLTFSISKSWVTWGRYYPHCCATYILYSNFASMISAAVLQRHQGQSMYSPLETDNFCLDTECSHCWELFWPDSVYFQKESALYSDHDIYLYLCCDLCLKHMTSRTNLKMTTTIAIWTLLSDIQDQSLKWKVYKVVLLWKFSRVFGWYHCFCQHTSENCLLIKGEQSNKVLDSQSLSSYYIPLWYNKTILIYLRTGMSFWAIELLSLTCQPNLILVCKSSWPDRCKLWCRLWLWRILTCSMTRS